MVGWAIIIIIVIKAKGWKTEDTGPQAKSELGYLHLTNKHPCAFFLCTVSKLALSFFDRASWQDRRRLIRPLSRPYVTHSTAVSMYYCYVLFPSATRLLFVLTLGERRRKNLAGHAETCPQGPQHLSHRGPQF